MHDETLYAERSLRAGASGYINKQEATREILTALRHVLEGRLYLSDRMSERLIRRTLDGTGHRASVEDLSDRELQVLELIGRGLKTSDVAKRLDLSIKTVETYRQRIKVKLQLRDGADLARYAAQWLVERPS